MKIEKNKKSVSFVKIEQNVSAHFLDIDNLKLIVFD